MCLKIAVSYFLIINFITFSAFGTDKAKAKKQKRRIPERHLFILAGLGGSLGALAAMYLFHHKTRKNAFRYGIPAIIATQIIIIYFLVY